MNLFLETRRLTSAREDHLTEFVSAALAVDQRFREEYTKVVLRGFAEDHGWPAPVIESTSTQVMYPEARCRPDLLLKLASGHQVICEHKLDASETELSSEDDAEVLGQLRRYLTLEVDGVAYFRAGWSPPDDEVVTHPRYIRPKQREHFLWEDLYESICAGRHEICQWLREGFEHLGLTPPHGVLGDLSGASEEVVENQKNFAKLWGLTRSRCRQLGWKVEAGSRCELYLRHGPCSIADLVYISPLHNRSRTLLIRVVPGEEEDPEALLERVRDATVSARVLPEVTMRSTRAGGKRPVVDVTVPLFEFLPEEGDPGAMQQWLLEFTEPVVRVASCAAPESSPEAVNVASEGP